MKKLKSLIVGTIIVITFFWGIPYFLINNQEEANCHSYHEFLSIHFDGMIIDKYIDQYEHLYPTIILRQNEMEKPYKFRIINEKSNLYDFLKVGDIISKDTNGNEVRIIRGNDTIYKEIDFGYKQNTNKLKNEQISNRK